MTEPFRVPPVPLTQVDRLLGLLPVAVFRMRLAGPLPRTAAPAVIAADLLERTRLDYANAAMAMLEGVPAGALTGKSLSQLSIGSLLSRVDIQARFIRSGFQLDQAEVRESRRGSAPRFFEVALVAVVDADAIIGLWGSIADVSAARDLARHVAAAEPEDLVVGGSAAISRVLATVAQVAATDTTVLITGETGTGKELIARAIHRGGSRAARPMIAVNCGAISATLVESELFGHEKGAFTGALNRKIGRFELADGGTLFLDEIGDLPLDLQVRLLRVLQEGEFTRVGGAETVRADVRVIAATHRDLPAAVRAGTFRQDLYYRLNVFPIKSPPLRDRREDIPLLVRHFTDHFAARLGKRIETIPSPLLDRLLAYQWPGNIRELANVIERSVIVTSGPTLQLAEWATGQYQPIGLAAVASSQSLEAMERDHIVRTLERTRWKVSGPGGAAEALNLKATTLEARIKKLGIARPK